MSSSVDEIKRREAGQAAITPEVADDQEAGQVSFFSVNRRQLLLLGAAATLLIAAWYLRRQREAAAEAAESTEESSTETTIHVPTDPVDQLDKDAAIVNSEIFAGANA